MELEFFACSHSVVWRKMYITVCVVHKATAVMAIAYNMKYVHCKWQRYRMVVFPQFLLVFGLSYRNLMGKTCWRCWRTWNINSCWNWISHISVDKIYTYITSLLLPDAVFFLLSNLSLACVFHYMTAKIIIHKGNVEVAMAHTTCAYVWMNEHGNTLSLCHSNSVWFCISMFRWFAFLLCGGIEKDQYFTTWIGIEKKKKRNGKEKNVCDYIKGS